MKSEESKENQSKEPQVKDLIYLPSTEHPPAIKKNKPLLPRVGPKHQIPPLWVQAWAWTPLIRKLFINLEKGPS